MKIIFFLFAFLPCAHAQQVSNPYANSTFSYQPYTGKLNCKDNPNEFAGTNFKMFNAAGSICNLPAGDFDKLVTLHGVALEDSMDLSEAIRRSDVTIAGDVHLFTDLKARKDLISKFLEIKGSGACLALELPKTGKSLDAFISDLKAKAKTTEQSGDKFQAAEQRDVIQYYESMIKFGEGKNAKVFGVDHPDNFDRDLTDSVRSESMTTNIFDLTQKKRCQSVLFVVGKAHENPNDVENPSMSNRLKARGLKTTTVNLQMTDERKMGPTLRTWDTCNEPAHRAKTLILKKADMLKDIKIMPRSGEGILLQDFDFTYLIPDSQNDVPCSSCVP